MIQVLLKIRHLWQHQIFLLKSCLALARFQVKIGLWLIFSRKIFCSQVEVTPIIEAGENLTALFLRVFFREQSKVLDVLEEGSGFGRLTPALWFLFFKFEFGWILACEGKELILLVIFILHLYIRGIIVFPFFHLPRVMPLLFVLLRFVALCMVVVRSLSRTEVLPPFVLFRLCPGRFIV